MYSIHLIFRVRVNNTKLTVILIIKNLFTTLLNENSTFDILLESTVVVSSLSSWSSDSIERSLLRSNSCMCIKTSWKKSIINKDTYYYYYERSEYVTYLILLSLIVLCTLYNFKFAIKPILINYLVQYNKCKVIETLNTFKHTSSYGSYKNSTSWSRFDIDSMYGLLSARCRLQKKRNTYAYDRVKKLAQPLRFLLKLL